MKLKDIVNSQAALKELAHIRVVVDKAMLLHEFYKIVETELAAYTAARNASIEKFGVKQENGTFYLAPDSENMPKFVTEMQAMEDKEVAIDIPAVLKSDMRGDISVATLTQLNWLLK